jgi:hypothetical protein
MKGMATKIIGFLPAIDHNGLRCRWLMADGKLRAVWEVR